LFAGKLLSKQAHKAAHEMPLPLAEKLSPLENHTCSPSPEPIVIKQLHPQRRGLRRDCVGAEQLLNQLAAVVLVINIEGTLVSSFVNT
jgi:hypothetical protein